MQPELSFTVQVTDAGKRLDLFLTEKIPQQSRNRIQNWISRERVTVGKQLRPASYRLREGDRVVVEPPLPEPLELTPEEIPIQVVLEDEYLVVVDKPAGLVVHPGAGNPAGTLANALLFHFQRVSRDETMRPGIVHRLDKETSGLLVVAKTDWVHEEISRLFKKRKVDKRYLALVHGRVAESHGTIDVPVGRHPTQRVKMSTRSRNPRSAKTDYRLKRRFQLFSYLELKLHTGRTHQIRVHLHYLGHPVVGDKLYGSGRCRSLDSTLRRQVRDLGRHFLHAAGLSFRHPVTGEMLELESPLPAELEKFLKSLS